MIEIVYTSGFLRQYNKLPGDLKEEVKEKIEIFKRSPKASMLKAHKLKGRLKGYWSFRINYKFRIVFEYDSKTTVALLQVGDHDVYR